MNKKVKSFEKFLLNELDHTYRMIELLIQKIEVCQDEKTELRFESIPTRKKSDRDYLEEKLKN
jgi:hypothetical protein